MKKLLVIGGSYFVGRVFVEEAGRTGEFEITVVNRGNLPLGMEGVREKIADRNDPVALKKAVSGEKWDGVVDFCAYTANEVEKLVSLFEPGTVDHYILISTVSVYAPTKNLPVYENAPTLRGPQPELGPASAYGYNKKLAEDAASRLLSQKDIPCTILRPAIIYGKYNYAPRESYFFDLVRENKTFVIPDPDLALFQFVCVSDVAEILMKSIGNEKTYQEAFNLSAPGLVSYGRIAEVMGEITGRPLRVVPMAPAEIDKRRLPLPFPLDSHLIYAGEKILHTLGTGYTPFREGMAQTYEWYGQTRGDLL